MCVCVCVCVGVCVCDCMCVVPSFFRTDNSSTVVIVCVTATIIIGIFTIILASVLVVFHKIRRAAKCNLQLFDERLFLVINLW